MKWIIAGGTDPGKVRTNNEDSFVVDEALGLLAVADGLGGHQSGEVASRMAVEFLQKNMKTLLASKSNPEGTNAKLRPATNHLAFCVKLANQAIFEASKKYPKDNGMGTTISSILLGDDSLSLAHVGDSRVYIQRNGQLTQITKDHSLVMDQLRKGLINEEQARTSNMQHVLSRALGIEEAVEVDAEEHAVHEGDYILLCSDGLIRMVTDKDIAAIIQSVKTPGEIAQTLIEAANAAGGKDNVTVIVALGEKGGGFLSKIFNGNQKKHA
ncbi:MAG: Stp1/IreP family PP2C-type Ser/Thr phosphatase [Elusimicrobia bacterium]|nr:Stp1/IreP family PP2C-type Ser/Thr phosphatase [Elusimicrobiota bacterium]